MEESHLQCVTFDHGMKSLLRQIVFYKQGDLADIKH